MHDLDQNEDRLRGTYGFPFEFHHIDTSHPRYIMSYHWHVEYEIMRVLEGTLTVTLDEKSFTAKAGDIIFVHSGILHSGIPEKCVYECIVFDMNAFLKAGSVCSGYIQRIVHQDIMIYHHFTAKQKEIIASANSIFQAFLKKRTDMSSLSLDNFTTFSVLFLVNITILRVSQKQGVIIRGFFSSNRLWNLLKKTTVPPLPCSSSLPLFPCLPNISAAFSRR